MERRIRTDRHYSGAVVRLAPLADRETREFLVDVEMKELPKSWTVGQRDETYIATSRKNQAVLIPPAAVVWRDGRAGVFINDKGHAAWRAIKIGLRGASEVEAIEGVAAGDMVIWGRDQKEDVIAEGRAVSPVKP